jgi:hypothetical protein
MTQIRVYLLIALLLGRVLFAQESGEAAVQTAKTAISNQWQNWVFAGSLLLTAATGILVVSLHTGSSPTNTTH